MEVEQLVVQETHIMGLLSVFGRISGNLSYFVENLTTLVGPLFVAVVWVLISGIVWSWYAFLRPYLWLHYGATWTVIHAIFAHWLLLNIVFHYYKGTTVFPGAPPQVSLDVYERGVQNNLKHCTKCKNLKPKRAHHCIACGTCVLNMDHHCPWMNSCIGHFNHRYFFLFMFYIWLGCIYIASVAYGPYIERRRLRAQLRTEGRLQDFSAELEMRGMPQNASQLSFAFVLTVAVIIALGLLISWHAFLITTAQTSIEFYTNMMRKKNAREDGNIWRNPYDFGYQKNWRIFLGLRPSDSWRKILFPSIHPPFGDGLHWNEHTYTEDRPYVAV